VQLERPFHYKQAQCGGVITFDLRPLAKESAWSTYGIPIAVAVLLVVMLYGVKLKLKSVRRR
jgi:ACR3 family arsenite efflux pump ArsB